VSRIRRFLSRSRPSAGGPAAPAPAPLPDLDGDTSASHMRHAHRLITVSRALHGRWLAGHDCVDLDAVDDAAADAIERLRSFRGRLAEERVLLAATDDIEEGL